MSALRLSRRGLFGGFAALLAAPAIVRVASIMPAVPVGLTKAEIQHEMAGVYRRYSGYDTLNVNARAFGVDAIEYDWMAQAVTITESGRELWLPT